MRRILEKTLAIFVAALLGFTTVFTAIGDPQSVFADDSDDWVYCSDCGERFLDEEDLCMFCKICPSCSTICEYCHLCENCYTADNYHCSECGTCCNETKGGYDPEYTEDDLFYCMDCGRRECCADFSHGNCGICDECWEARVENGCQCEHCGKMFLTDDLADDPDVDTSDMEFVEPADCGIHCEDCVEDNECIYCGVCFLCETDKVCEYCEENVCLDCAKENGYHCPLCGECYNEVGQCEDNGEHCRKCCEDNAWLCEGCGTCSEAENIEFCGFCHMCEDCAESEGTHCPLCGECYENVGECENGGEHCRQCCEEEGWLCENCGECTEGKGITFCDECGLCEDCCRHFSEEAGGDGGKCIADPEEEAYWEEVHEQSGKHILEYAFDDECHWLHCTVKGCDYVEDRQPHTKSDEYTVVKPATLTEDGYEAITCEKCKHIYETRVLPMHRVHFGNTPHGVLYGTNKESIQIVYQVLNENNEECYGYVTLNRLNPGEKWPEDPQKCEDEHSMGTLLTSNSPEDEKKNIHYLNCKGYDYRTATYYDLSDTTYRYRLILHSGKTLYYSDEFIIRWSPAHFHVWQWDYKATQFDAAGNPLLYHCQRCTCGEVRNWGYCYMVLVNETEATCQNAGTKVYQCQDCGRVRAEYTPKLSECVAGSWEELNVNYHIRRCIYCERELQRAEHKMNIRAVTSSCEKVTQEYRCDDCGFSHVVTTPGKGHKFPRGWSYNEKYHYHVCKNCSTIEREEHTMSGNECLYCDYVSDGVKSSVATYHTTNVMSLPYYWCEHMTLSLDYTFDDGFMDILLGEGPNWAFVWKNSAGRVILLGKNAKRLDIAAVKSSLQPEDTISCSVIDAMGKPYMTVYSYYGQGATVDEHQPTCVTPGNIEYLDCICGKKYDKSGKVVTDVTIPATGIHTYDDDCDSFCNVCAQERVAPHGVREDGCDEVMHWTKCHDCGMIFSEGPHKIVWHTTKAMTCTRDGEMEGTCEECLKTLTKVLKATGHVLGDFGKPSTCVTHGTESYYQCASCKVFYSDPEATTLLPEDFTPKELPLDPNNHEGGYWQNDETTHWIKCKCGEHLKAGNHVFASWKQEGEIEIRHCKVCGCRQEQDHEVEVETEESTEIVASEQEPATGNGSQAAKIIMILILVLLILILLAVAAIIITVVLRKKKDKKEQKEDSK